MRRLKGRTSILGSSDAEQGRISTGRVIHSLTIVIGRVGIVMHSLTIVIRRVGIVMRRVGIIVIRRVGIVIRRVGMNPSASNMPICLVTTASLCSLSRRFHLASHRASLIVEHIHVYVHAHDFGFFGW